MFSSDILEAAQSLTERCLEQGVRLVLAESCTGGLAAAAMTELPGSSRVVDRGFVVYSNEAKMQELGVPEELIQEHGAVSEPVARAMAAGALAKADDGPHVAIAITGVAGPGESEAKPAGRVHIVVAQTGSSNVLHQMLELRRLGREQVRAAAVLAALQLAAHAMEAALDPPQHQSARAGNIR